MNFLFFPSEENVGLCLANVCCVVKGCKNILGKSYSLEKMKMTIVKVVLTE